MEERLNRGLSTARAVLQVEWLLARTPDGVRADQVARTLGKSISTAYNLLASLCEEGVAVRRPGGVYALAPSFRTLVAGSAAASGRRDFAALVDDLLARTHKRAYFAIPEPNGVRVLIERGVQGMPKLSGLEPELLDNLHAVALGKVVLAHAPAAAVERYVARGMAAFTANTITSPARLGLELRRVRRAGIAGECEEFDWDFCCLAAPIFDRRHQLVGVVGISMTRRAYDDERPALEETLRDVARFQPSADHRAVLDPHESPVLASAAGREVQQKEVPA